ncbi:hypothetical protein JCM10207_007169 [Rhodosporidiobolus poonsookiae]
MTSLPRIVVVGGHGKVALHFARLASPSFSVHSLVRTQDHFADLESAGAKPVLLSLEEASVADLSAAFKGAQGVLFSAGSGGKGGPERTKKVDEEGAIKVMDAIEQLEGEKPKFVLVGAIDTRDMSKPPPSYYTEADIAESKKTHDAIPAYYDAKLHADRSLHQRTAFPWVILRPGWLTEDAPTGKVRLGRTGWGGVSRADVAATLLALFRLPSSGAGSGSSLALDLIQGTDSDVPIEQAIKEAVEKGIWQFVIARAMPTMFVSMKADVPCFFFASGSVLGFFFVYFARDP